VQRTTVVIMVALAVAYQAAIAAEREYDLLDAGVAVRGPIRLQPSAHDGGKTIAFSMTSGDTFIVAKTSFEFAFPAGDATGDQLARTMFRDLLWRAGSETFGTIRFASLRKDVPDGATLNAQSVSFASCVVQAGIESAQFTLACYDTRFREAAVGDKSTMMMAVSVKAASPLFSYLTSHKTVLVRFED
jgi:hypothetical protein